MSPDEETQTQPAPQATPPAAAPAQAAPTAAAPKPAATANVAGDADRRPSRFESPRRESRDRDDGDDRGGGRRRFFGRRKVCSFCVEKAKQVDYKDPGKLRRFVSDRGRIEGRRRTGTCAKHQRWLATALKRARHLALLPYSPEHIRMSGTFASRRR